jgi:tubulin epsilon
MQVFMDVFAREHQLIRADPRHGTYLACGLLMRGATANISDINRNITRIKPSLRMVHWNNEVGAGCHAVLLRLTCNSST